MIRRTFFATTAVAALLVASACGSDSGDGDSEYELTFLTPFSFILAYSDAMNGDISGHYADEGLSVDFEAAQGSAQALTQVLAGQADIARSDAVDVVNAIVTQDAPLRVIAPITQQTPFYVVSAEDDPVASAADLEGKTIGIISVGGATDNLLQLMLAEAGIDPASVDIQTVGSGAGSWGLIEQGRIDAFIDTSSSRVALEAAGQPILSWSVGDEVVLPSQVYVVTEQTLEDKPEELAAFLRGTRSSMEEILATDDLEATIEEMGSTFELGDASNTEQAVNSLQADSQLWAAAGEDQLLVNQPEQWEQGIALLHEAGLIDEAPDPASVYTNEIYDLAFGQGDG